MHARRISFLALSALPLIACTQPAEELAAKSSELAIAEPDVAFDPDLVVAPPPPDLAVSTLEVGDGWRRIRVAGRATDVDTSAVVAVDRELLVITDKTKVATAPVAKFVKTEIEAELAAPKTKTFLAAGALPEGEEADIIDVQAAAAAETAMNSGAPTAMFACSSEERTFSKTISTTKTYAHEKTSETGKLTGSVALTSTLAASGTGSVTIKVHRSAWTLCAPYKVSFRRASFRGTTNVTAKANVDATFEAPWKYDKKIAQPSLGTLSFAIGPVPVAINFSAPIHVGVEATAKATLKLDQTATARASLDYSCTTGGCAGSKSATFTTLGGSSPIASVNARVDVTPYAYAGVHANLYTDWIANAEIGVKAKVKGELWGYSGNTCGDGDFNGTNEFVSAAALDTRFGIDLVAKASVVGSDFGPWTWNLLDRHLAFFDLGSSTPSSAMAPMLNVKANPLGSTTALANGRMRPCWPWTDKMKYRINFNDGTVEDFWESPSVMFGRTHAYASYGSKVVSVTAVVDEQGRTPGKTTTDSVYLRAFVFDPIFATTAASL
jgi:hypothetical protein